MRLLTLLSKLILISLAVATGGIDLVGQVGVVLAIIGFIPTVAGLELYQKLNRKTSFGQISSYGLFYQLNLALSLFLAAVIGCLSLIFLNLPLSFSASVLLIISVLLECVFLDLNRYQYASKRFFVGTVSGFLKSFLVVPVVYILPDMTPQNFIVRFVLIDALVKAILSYVFFKAYGRRIRLTFGILKQTISRGYYQGRIKRSKSFILMSVSLNAFEYSDRLFLAMIFSPKQLGLYVLALSIVSAVKSLIYFGPVAKRYPQAVLNISKAVKGGARSFIYEILISGFFLTAVSVLGVYLVTGLEVVDFLREFSQSGQRMELLGAITMLSLSVTVYFVGHYLLYGAKLDRINAWLNLFVFVGLVLAIFSLGPQMAHEVLLLKAFILLLGSVMKILVFLRWEFER